MASTSIYLNFSNQTEQAFEFYRSVFGGEFKGKVSRFGDIPPTEKMPPLSDIDKNLIMNMTLPILGGVMLMGTDAPESMGFKINPGNNVYICLSPDTRAECDRLFKELSVNGKIEIEMAEMFWGDYYGSFADQFWVQWMIDSEAKS